jgi:hypothetical protein
MFRWFLYQRNLRAIAPVVFLFTLGLVLLLGQPTIAESINRATITQVLDSSQVFIQNKQAQVNDAASKGQRVRTGKARAQIVFNTGAVGRLAHNSVLTIGQCAKLKQGTILINGAMNGCSSSMIAGVRGTTYLLTVDEAGTTDVKVLEGEVTVRKAPPSLQTDDGEEGSPATGTKQLTPSGVPANSLPDPTIRRDPFLLNPGEPRPDKQPPVLTVEQEPQKKSEEEIVLKSGESVNVSQTGSLGSIRKLSQEDYIALLTGELFNGFPEIPGIAKVRQTFQRLFPGVPFPVPSVPIPSIPTPRIRLPF